MEETSSLLELYIRKVADGYTTLLSINGKLQDPLDIVFDTEQEARDALNLFISELKNLTTVHVAQPSPKGTVQ